MISITPSALAAIQDHARSAYPEECCGILLGTLPSTEGLTAATILEIIPAQNLAPSNRATRFTLDPRAYIHADREAQDRGHGIAVIGCYHTHPDHPAIPSATDVSLAWPDFLYLILPLTAQGPGTPRIWHYEIGEPREIPLALP